ncbi:hypothetical protein BGZ63DRAFT_206300 [Mariannaea sp. PMI_226]|nr:hypothetical protein BGZ63DRAFT_206300 [Mariannaea sp. PMI_226]
MPPRTRTHLTVPLWAPHITCRNPVVSKDAVRFAVRISTWGGGEAKLCLCPVRFHVSHRKAGSRTIPLRLTIQPGADLSVYFSYPQWRLSHHGRSRSPWIRRVQTSYTAAHTHVRSSHPHTPTTAASWRPTLHCSLCVYVFTGLGGGKVTPSCLPLGLFRNRAENAQYPRRGLCISAHLRSSAFSPF